MSSWWAGSAATRIASRLKRVTRASRSRLVKAKGQWHQTRGVSPFPPPVASPRAVSASSLEEVAVKSTPHPRAEKSIRMCATAVQRMLPVVLATQAH